MSDEAELRELHEAWFAASARRDIKASMAPIARDVVSYEHSGPLYFAGIEAVRAVCQQGFDDAIGDLQWSVPDLKVVADGDLAVAWGLNHMLARQNGATTMDMWSRGTRIFRRIDGRWQMVHQHVSFPFDPATGKAVLDATP